MDVIEVGATKFQVDKHSFFGVYVKDKYGVVSIIEEFRTQDKAFARATYLSDKIYKCPIWLK
jgi:hypothetical protein